MISVNKLQELFSNVLRIVLMCIFRDRLVSGAQVDCIVSKNMARKELIALAHTPNLIQTFYVHGQLSLIFFFF